MTEPVIITTARDSTSSTDSNHATNRLMHTKAETLNLSLQSNMTIQHDAHTVSEISRVQSFDEEVPVQDTQQVIVLQKVGHEKQDHDASAHAAITGTQSPIETHSKSHSDDLHSFSNFSPSSPLPPHLNFQSTARRRRSADTVRKLNQNDDSLIPITSFVSPRNKDDIFSADEEAVTPNCTGNSSHNVRRSSLHDYNDDSSVTALSQIKSTPPSTSPSNHAKTLSSVNTATSHSPLSNSYDNEPKPEKSTPVSSQKFSPPSPGSDSPDLRIQGEPELEESSEMDDEEVDSDDDNTYNLQESVMRSTTPKNHSFRYINPLALDTQRAVPKADFALSPVIASGRSSARQQHPPLKSLNNQSLRSEGDAQSAGALEPSILPDPSCTSISQSVSSEVSVNGPTTSDSAVIQFKASKKPSSSSSVRSTVHSKTFDRNTSHDVPTSHSNNDLLDDTRSCSTEPDETDYKLQEGKVALMRHKPSIDAFESNTTEIIRADLNEEAIDEVFRMLQRELAPDRFSHSVARGDCANDSSVSPRKRDLTAPPADAPSLTQIGAPPQMETLQNDQPHDDLFWVSSDTNNLAKRLSELNVDNMSSARGDEHDLSFDDDLESAQFSPHRKSFDVRGSVSLYSSQEDGVVMHLQLSEDDEQDDLMDHMNGFDDDLSDFDAEEHDFTAMMGDDEQHNDLNEGFVVF